MRDSSPSYPGSEYLPVLATYLRFERLCGTLNELRKVQSEFANRSTPDEVRFLAHALNSRVFHTQGIAHRVMSFLLRRELTLKEQWGIALPRSFSRLKATLSARWAKFLWESIESTYPEAGGKYRRELAMGGLLLYRGNSASGEKDLLLWFSGGLGRPGAPISVMLAALPDTAFDVVVFTLGQKPGYLKATRQPQPKRELADQLLERLHSIDVRPADYRAIHTFGLSAGAGVSLFVGLRVGARTLTSVGTLRVDDTELRALTDLWQKTPGPPSRSGEPPLPPAIRFISGEQSAKDVTVAHQLARSLSGSEVVIVSDAPHSPVWPLHRRGELSEFLGATLSQPSRSAHWPASCRVETQLEEPEINRSRQKI